MTKSFCRNMFFQLFQYLKWSFYSYPLLNKLQRLYPKVLKFGLDIAALFKKVVSNPITFIMKILLVLLTPS